MAIEAGKLPNDPRPLNLEKRLEAIAARKHEHDTALAETTQQIGKLETQFPLPAVIDLACKAAKDPNDRAIFGTNMVVLKPEYCHQFVKSFPSPLAFPDPHAVTPSAYCQQIAAVRDQCVAQQIANEKAATTTPPIVNKPALAVTEAAQPPSATVGGWLRSLGMKFTTTLSGVKEQPQPTTSAAVTSKREAQKLQMTTTLANIPTAEAKVIVKSETVPPTVKPVIAAAPKPAAVPPSKTAKPTIVAANIVNEQPTSKRGQPTMPEQFKKAKISTPLEKPTAVAGIAATKPIVEKPKEKPVAAKPEVSAAISAKPAIEKSRDSRAIKNLEISRPTITQKSQPTINPERQPSVAVENLPKRVRWIRPIARELFTEIDSDIHKITDEVDIHVSSAVRSHENPLTKKKPDSAHAKKLAWDMTLRQRGTTQWLKPNENLARIMEYLATIHEASNGLVKVHFEHPTMNRNVFLAPVIREMRTLLNPNATGPHIHVEINPKVFYALPKATREIQAKEIIAQALTTARNLPGGILAKQQSTPAPQAETTPAPHAAALPTEQIARAELPDRKQRN